MLTEIFDKSGDLIAIDAPYTIIHEYSNNPPENFLETQERALKKMAEDKEISMLMHREGNVFHFGFSTIRDKTEFERSAFNPPDAPGTYIHTQTFEADKSKDYIGAWKQAVIDKTKEMGIHCEMDAGMTNLTVRLDNIEDYCAFMELMESEYFDRMALIKTNPATNHDECSII